MLFKFPVIFANTSMTVAEEKKFLFINGHGHVTLKLHNIKIYIHKIVWGDDGNRFVQQIMYTNEFIKNK